ncbi:Calx-beta domain-containing protein, partial [Vibrio sp. 10N.247.310.81]
MDMTVLNASGALALGQRIVISIDGTIKVLEDGQPLQAGDVVLEAQNANSESQISVKRFTPQGKDGDEVDLDQDIENIFAALEEGQDPTELGEEFATAAGVRGSSLVSSGTIERDGDETIPVTEFVTTGFEGLVLSRTQSLSLLDLFRSVEVEPTVTIEDSQIINEGSTAIFEVSLSKAASGDVSVTLETLYGTATADDITSVVVKDAAGNVVTPNADGSYTVPAGETKLVVEVATKDDGTYEGDEKLSLKVTGATGVTGTGTGELTIKDDGTGPVDPTDPTPPGNPDDRPSVSIEDSKVINEGSTASFDVSLSKAASIDVSVTLETLYGTATADDINSVVVKDAAGNVVTPNADGSYTVKAGETQLTVEVATQDDATYEGDEKLSLKVTGVTGVNGTDTSDLTITDDGTGPVDPGTPNPDDRPSVSIEDSKSINEGSTASFGVTLTKAAAVDVTVDIDTLYGTATAEDITSIVVKDSAGQVVTANADGSYTVKAGETQLTVEVATKDDATYEGDEKLSLKVTGVTGVNGTDTSDLTITDDGTGPVDPGKPTDNDKPTLTVGDAAPVVEGQSASFAVSLSNAVDADLTYKFDLDVSDNAEIADFVATGGKVMLNVNYTVDGQAVNNTVENGKTLSIPGNAVGITVVVATQDDPYLEGAENFKLKVNVSGTVGDGNSIINISDVGTGTITDETTTDPTDPNPKDTVFAQISVDQASVTEGGELTYTITLVDKDGQAVDVPAGQSVAVALDWSGAAAGGADTSALPSSVTVTGNSTSFKVQTTDDALNEGSEQLNVQVTGVTDTDNSFEQVAAATGNAGQANSTITDETTTDPTDPNPKDT